MADIQIANSGPPLLVVLSGPSGVGKDAALEQLKRLDRPWYFAVTATTRAPREGERDGVEYIFLENETFRQMQEQGEFLECAEVYGKWYGVPRSQIRDSLQNGNDVILKVDVQGAATVRALAPGVVSILIVPKSLAELRQRLIGRMTESSPEIELRLRTAAQELEQVQEFDYCVINEDGHLDRAIRSIEAIITSEKCRVTPRIVQL